MTEERAKVLIVDDERINLNILFDLLHPMYQIMAANTGQKALKIAISDNPPDLILLDIVMPKMDGYTVCRELKSDERARDIPIIFVTAKGQTADETKGLELGAVDYITKPLNPAVVKARIATHLKLRKAMQELERMYALALDANPLTGLPGNTSIVKRVSKAIEEGQPVCVVYADIDNFKAFNDAYGFSFGDDVIIMTAEIFAQVLSSEPDSFVGHIGGDDFVLLVPTDKVTDIANSIISSFDKRVRSVYSEKDRAVEGIQAIDRQGQLQTFPIMTISLACVELEPDKFSQFVEVNDACVEVKKKAKMVKGSIFVMDRRK